MLERTRLHVGATVGFLLLACGGGTADSTVWPQNQDPTTTSVAPTADPAASATPAITAFPTYLQRDWRTDFDKRSVSPSDVQQGQTKDGIPAISDPKFLAVSEASFLKDREPVVAFEFNGDARAYPLQILIWHEIVNDFVGGEPVLITFCPLCNTAIAFERRVEGSVLEFGVSGFLRNSDLIMFDRDTETWWQQATGEGIVGHFTGTRLELLPSVIVSWQDFRETFPEGKVLSPNTGFARPYGENPYIGYDDIDSTPFLFSGKSDSRLQAMERVVTIEFEDETAAYPFSRLESTFVVHDSVGGQAVVIFFKPGTASALDKSSIANSKDIGSAAVFVPSVAGRSLTFRVKDKVFVDDETGSTWDIFGKAIAGPLQGEALPPVVSGNHFWFAWAAFQPETRIWQP